MFLVACGQDSSHLHKIVGANDLITVERNGANIPAEFRNLISAIVKISTGCTGAHIGDGYILTAGHCLSSSYTDGPKKSDSCPTLSVTWGPGGEVSQCTYVSILEFNQKRDFAIFRVNRYSRNKLPLRQDIQSRAGESRRLITLFSYPKKTDQLAWSKECSIQLSSNATSRITYQCDTVDGSSGAPLIDVETRSIIGVHNGAGSFFQLWNYGTLAVSIPLEAAGIVIRN